MKTCVDCGLEKNLTDFYMHHGMADGRLNKCKDCVRARVSKHRVANIDKIREYDRKRGSTPDRIERHKRYITSEGGKAVKKEVGLRWIKRNPEKRKAQLLLQRAVKTGQIVRQPCEKCGGVAHGHHEDYSLPLVVRWLCPKHHTEEHKKHW